LRVIEARNYSAQRDALLAFQEQWLNNKRLRRSLWALRKPRDSALKAAARDAAVGQLIDGVRLQSLLGRLAAVLSAFRTTHQQLKAENGTVSRTVINRLVPTPEYIVAGRDSLVSTVDDLVEYLTVRENNPDPQTALKMLEKLRRDPSSGMSILPRDITVSMLAPLLSPPLNLDPKGWTEYALNLSSTPRASNIVNVLQARLFYDRVGKCMLLGVLGTRNAVPPFGLTMVVLADPRFPEATAAVASAARYSTPLRLEPEWLGKRFAACINELGTVAVLRMDKSGALQDLTEFRIDRIRMPTVTFAPDDRVLRSLLQGFSFSTYREQVIRAVGDSYFVSNFAATVRISRNPDVSFAATPLEWSVTLVGGGLFAPLSADVLMESDNEVVAFSPFRIYDWDGRTAPQFRRTIAVDAVPSMRVSFPHLPPALACTSTGDEYGDLLVTVVYYTGATSVFISGSQPAEDQQ
jgi:hypothetical protein